MTGVSIVNGVAVVTGGRETSAHLVLALARDGSTWW